MRRARGLGLTGCCRIAALLVLLAVTFPTLDLRPPAPVTAVEPDTCVGDEMLFFAPLDPVVGEVLLVAATSSVQHRGVWLQGTEPAAPLRERIGLEGYVWDFIVTPQLDGPHYVRFYVDSVTLCAEGEIDVAPSLLPGRPADDPSAIAGTPSPTPEPTWISLSDNSSDNDADNSDNESSGDNESPTRTPVPTRTPTPTRTPSPTREVNEAPGGNEAPTATGTAAPTSTRTPVPTRTPVDTRTPQPTAPSRPTPTLKPSPTNTLTPTPWPAPVIDSLNPSVVCPGGTLTIKGSGFGPSRSAARGAVVIGGSTVETYLSWAETQIEVLVPKSATRGFDQPVILATSGGSDEGRVDVANSC